MLAGLKRIALIVGVGGAVVLPPSLAGAQSLEDVVDIVNRRAANEGRIGFMNFKMTNKNGVVRNRRAVLVHADLPEVVKIAIHFTEPMDIEGTAFLGINKEGADDENWLYLPATERVRRLPASDEKDSFMGTDLSYGDVLNDFTFPESDWQLSLKAPEILNGKTLPVLHGVPVSPEKAQEIGYSAFDAVIDTETGFPIDVAYYDLDGAKFKTVKVNRQVKIKDAWTAIDFVAQNIVTGHMTEITFDEMTAVEGMDQEVFNPEFLEYGPPDAP